MKGKMKRKLIEFIRSGSNLNLCGHVRVPFQLFVVNQLERHVHHVTSGDGEGEEELAREVVVDDVWRGTQAVRWILGDLQNNK